MGSFPFCTNTFVRKVKSKKKPFFFWLLIEGENITAALSSHLYKKGDKGVHGEECWLEQGEGK